MRSKVLKIGTVLLACVCLISFMAFPVSALGESLNGLNVISSYSFDGDNIDVRDLSASIYTSDVFEMSICLRLVDEAGPFSEYIYLQDKCVTSLKVQFDKKAIFTFDVAQHMISIYKAELVNAETSERFECDVVEMGNRTIGDNNNTYGTSKITVNVPESYVEYYLVLTGECIASEQTDGTLFMYFYNISSKNNDTQDIIDNQNQNAEDIIQNQSQNANEIMENQNENTQSIIDAQQQATQEQTDEITNGWQGADSVDDGTTDDLKNAEDAALGGKTDEEIQEEISGALEFDFDSFTGSGGFNRVRVLFGNVYNALGTSWQSLFLLSLTIGLGAFLIGRRYG